MKRGSRWLWPAVLVGLTTLVSAAALLIAFRPALINSARESLGLADRPTATRTYSPGRVIQNPNATLSAVADSAPPATVRPTSTNIPSFTPLPTAADVSPTASLPVSSLATPTAAATKMPTETTASSTIPATSAAAPTAAPAGPTATPSRTATPTTLPTGVVVPTGTPQPTATPTATPIPVARVSGRVTFNGAPVPAGVTVKLEDWTYTIVASAVTDAQGAFAFEDLTDLGSGLNLLFAQEWNEQYSMSQVVSWAWLGPIALSAGGNVTLPDLEIGLLGFGPLQPPAGASFSSAAITAANPLIFSWNAYPGAAEYWVELAKGEELIPVWSSPPVTGTSVPFDGTLRDGTHISAGFYWWNVGTRVSLAGYWLTLYGYLPGLEITP